MKVFATAIELVFIAILSWVLLGYPINIQTVLAVCIVSCAVIIYANNPIKKPQVTININKHVTNI